MAVLSWRGLDGMSRAQSQTQQRANEVLTLQSGLSQWAADLEAMTQTAQLNAIDWNGQVLRITRRSSAATGDGLSPGVSVVAWTQRGLGNNDATGLGVGGQWLRWESPAAQTRGDLANAWQRAALWAQNPSQDEKRLEIAIAPVTQWQVYYYRADAWVNAQSSDATTPLVAAPPIATPAAPAASSVASGSNTGSSVFNPAVNLGGGVVSASGSTATAAITAAGLVAIPEGVRLVLTLAPGQALSGVITRDWVRSTVGGGKS